MVSKKLCKLLFLLLAVLLLLNINCKAQDEKLKAIFVYNFTRYLGWPQKPGNFVILILGKSAIYAELTDISLKKKVGNTNIEVRSINTVQEFTDCHIIYVTAGKTDLIPSIVSMAKSRNILIVSEKEGACKDGSGINFINNEGKLIFEISRNDLAASGLTVSTTLFTLGKVINE